MKISKTSLMGVFTIDAVPHTDERGFFFEGFSKPTLEKNTGYRFDVAQINHSRSYQHVLRGLHYQVNNTQAKLVWTTFGEIYDVVVDLRRSSPSFGHWFGVNLSAQNMRRLLIPEGCAHGFIVLSEVAEITYLTSDIYNPAGERVLRWNCPEIGIKWPINNPILNERDALAPRFENCELFS